MLSSIEDLILKINKEVRNKKISSLDLFEQSSFSEKTTKHIDKLILELYRFEKIRMYYNEQTLKKEIVSFVLSNIKLNQQDFFNNLEQLIDNFVRELNERKPQPIMYVVPIENLMIESDIFVGNVKLVNESSKSIQKIIDDYESKLTGPNESVNNYLKELLYSRLRKKNNSLAILEVDGIDIDQAKRKCLEDSLQAINILRFFYFSLFGHTLSYKYNYFGVSGMNFRKSQLNEFMILKETSKIDSKNYLSVPVKFTESSYQQIKPDLNALNEIIKSKSRTEVETLLLTAIDFFGESVNDFIVKYSFLNLFVCLEILLMRYKEKQITTILSYRVAKLLGDSYKTKEKICKDIQELYDIRSSLVHKGIQSISYSSLLLLGSYTFDVINKILKHSKSFGGQEKLIMFLDCITMESENDFEKNLLTVEQDY